MKPLMAHWMRMCARRGVPAHTTTEWWGHIVRRHSESHRHFHTMARLQSMHEHFVAVEATLANPEAIFWSIVFHGTSFSVHKSGDENAREAANEWLGFVAAVEDDRAGVFEEPFVFRVEENILQSGHPTRIPDDVSSDVLHFLDIGFAWLGVSKDKYARLSRQWQIEYSHLPRDKYSRYRVGYLRNLLSLPRLFHTKHFSDNFASPATTNALNEIQLLESPPFVVEPLYFADRDEVHGWERQQRRRDPSKKLALSLEDVKWVLSMNTGHLSVAYRHEESKELIATIISSLTELSDDAIASLPPCNRPGVAVPLNSASAGKKEDLYDPALREEHSVIGDHLLIHSMCVAETFRGRGIALHIWKYFIDEMLREIPQLRRVTCVVPQTMVERLTREGFGVVREYAPAPQPSPKQATPLSADRHSAASELPRPDSVLVAGEAETADDSGIPVVVIDEAPFAPKPFVPEKAGLRAGSPSPRRHSLTPVHPCALVEMSFAIQAPM